RVPASRLADIFLSAGFFSQPDLALPQAPAITVQELDREKTILGSNNTTVSPLQMVLAASSLSSNGIRPAPRITMAVNTPTQGWVILPAGQKSQAFTPDGVEFALSLLKEEDSLFWHITTSVPSSDSQIHWFVGGTLPDWQGTPLALAIAIEGDTAESTDTLGKNLLNSVMLQ
ncbi:MAG TPA: hypothetical protein VF338_11270, partial [Leptolinea sp.]